jgi:hypothetical protein
MGLFTGCAASAAAGTDDIPESLRVSASEVLTQKLHATGVQIYTCTAGKDGAAHFEWVLKAPDAELSDRGGKQIARHYAGPTWEARDGSKVLGQLIAKADSPDANAVPWLLLRAKSASGSGIFAAVRFIQRLHTVGGSAPAKGCDEASAGRDIRVPYSAEYWFYIDKP